MKVKIHDTALESQSVHFTQLLGLELSSHITETPYLQNEANTCWLQPACQIEQATGSCPVQPCKPPHRSCLEPLTDLLDLLLHQM